MHTHILGICGTFMAGVAVLAKALGHKVTGQDAKVYPPMSTQLQSQGIEITEGFEKLPDNLKPDQIVVGNIMSRGMPVIEDLLEQQKKLISGPEWLYQNILKDKWVLAVSGTHGKTTTSSMLAWILEYAGKKPGFLIGGMPENFGVSARLGDSDFFVLEADEYDSAFFDKRSKFLHYWPKTLIINNLEFDHADIFENLEAIQKQFHHLVRTVPKSGQIIYPEIDKNIKAVLEKGCWSEKKPIQKQTIQWDLIGEHNANNGSAAVMAAQHVGISTEIALKALSEFKGVKRRLELKGKKAGVTVYDDFAHHPTAIKMTLSGLKQKINSKAKERVIALIDIRSNTMVNGDHKETLGAAVMDADQVYFYHKADLTWDLKEIFDKTKKTGGVFQDFDKYLENILAEIREGDHVVCMSNGAFEGVSQALQKGL